MSFNTKAARALARARKGIEEALAVGMAAGAKVTDGVRDIVLQATTWAEAMADVDALYTASEDAAWRNTVKQARFKARKAAALGAGLAGLKAKELDPALDVGDAHRKAVAHIQSHATLHEGAKAPKRKKGNHSGASKVTRDAGAPDLPAEMVTALDALEATFSKLADKATAKAMRDAGHALLVAHVTRKERKTA